MDRWAGKVALVTGASAGIGAEIVKQLAVAGVKVFGLARRAEKVEEIKKTVGKVDGEIIPLKGDVGKEDEIIEAFQVIKEKFGAIHILVNNAGIVRFGNVSVVKPEYVREVFDVNVIGLTICTQQALKLMKESGVNDGHIIHINSVLGHLIPNIGATRMTVYPASKYAVTALTESLRQELNFLKTKIKVSSVSPGLVGTELFEVSAKSSGVELTEDARKTYDERVKLHPKDVADAVMYVLSTPPHVQVHELILRPVGDII